MPENILPAPALTVAIHKPLWTHDIDAPTLAGGMVAISTRTAAFESNGLMCGFAVLDGSKRWCSIAGSAPAYADGTVAFTASDGGVRALDADTGLWRWGGADNANRFGEAATVYPVGQDFLVAGYPGQLFGALRFEEVTADGASMWSAQGIGGGKGELDTAWPSAVLHQWSSGATMSAYRQVLHLGQGGGLSGVLDDVWTVLDLDDRRGVFGGDWMVEEQQDRFLTFDVEIADVGDASVMGRFHFEPDYDENRGIWESGGFPPTPPLFTAIRSDGEFVYVAVSQKIYRYTLAKAAAQHPLMVASDAFLLGGPYRGWLYAQRSNGVWAFQAGPTSVSSRLVAQETSNATAIAVSGREVYIGFADGELRGIDADDGRTVLDAQPGRAEHIAFGPHEVLVICHEGRDWRVTAYSR